MAGVLVGGLPPGLVLGAGCTVEFHAVDPTSNADIADVQLNAITIWADGVVGDQSGAFSTPFTLIDPVLLHKT